jgi:SNF family Na+-dependent transporter
MELGHVLTSAIATMVASHGSATLRRVAETGKQRIDRELIELLNELRVALPGVQILFAVLLVLPFNTRFDQVDQVERIAYLVALLMAAAGTALLIAPSPYHRLHFRAADKERVLFTGNKLLLGGTVCTAISTSLVVFLIADFLYGSVVGTTVGLATAVWFGWFWYGLPLRKRLQGDPRAMPGSMDTEAVRVEPEGDDLPPTGATTGTAETPVAPTGPASAPPPGSRGQA